MTRRGVQQEWLGDQLGRAEKGLVLGTWSTAVLCDTVRVNGVAISPTYAHTSRAPPHPSWTIQVRFLFATGE